MNREDAKKLWPIIKAFGDGEEVEWLSGKNNWKPKSETCGFDQDPSRYRIKPEPREFWLEQDGGWRVIAGNGPDAHCTNFNRIKVREVIE